MIQGHACASDGQAQIGRIIEVQADAGAAEGNLLGLYQLNGGLTYDLILIHQLYAYGTQLSGSCGKQTGGSVDGTHLSAVLIEGPGQAGLRQRSGGTNGVNAGCLKLYGGSRISSRGGIVLVVGGQAGMVKHTAGLYRAGKEERGADGTGSTVGGAVPNGQSVGALTHGNGGGGTAAVDVQGDDTALCSQNLSQIIIGFATAGGSADAVGGIGDDGAVGLNTQGGTAVL